MGKFGKDPSKNIVSAIVALGGISPQKLEKSGVKTEWTEWMPAYLYMQIFRRNSTNGPDDIATQLAGLGYPVEDCDSLLQYLKDPQKREWSLEPRELQISRDDYMEREVRELRRENEELKRQLAYYMRSEGCFDPIEEESYDAGRI